ncbi:hypothetical protein ACSSS7_002952 [Eimeria intestinalis]
MLIAAAAAPAAVAAVAAAAAVFAAAVVSVAAVLADATVAVAVAAAAAAGGAAAAGKQLQREDSAQRKAAAAAAAAARRVLNEATPAAYTSKEVLQKYNRFLARLQATTGAASGKAFLPSPQQMAVGDLSNTERLHLYEECVLLWARQIRAVLERNPAQPLAEGRNPEPNEEIDFWADWAAELQFVSEQLDKPFVVEVYEFLAQNNSTYLPLFDSLRNDVEAAKEEALDNTKFLSTLQPWVKKLMDETAELTAVLESLEPTFETILLIWQYSRFYNKPSRLVVLVRQLCNAIITQVMRYVSGQDVFKLLQQDEPKEALDKLSFALERAEAEGKPWALKPEVIFLRLDTYRERNVALSSVTTTAQQFSKLEKIEICGSKGSQLSASIQNLQEDFRKLMESFQQIDFDPLNVDCKKTDSHFHAFRAGVKEIEQRLASVLAMSFEDCGTITSRVRLFDSFVPLLERPILREEAATQFTKLLQQFKEEVKEIHAIFLEGRKRQDEDTPAFANQPPVAKALNWAAGLLQRLREPLQRLEKLGQTIGEEPEELKDVCRQCESVAASIVQYQETLRRHWSETEVEPSRAKLAAVLLKRQEGSLLKVNFHPDLTRLLREVKYMELQGLQVPAAAKAVHARAEIYRVQVSSLETICGQYNQVLTGLLPNQKPLLADRLSLIDSKLEPGLTTLSWESDGVDDFISQASLAVSDAFTICDSITSNLQKSFGQPSSHLLLTLLF